jgi:malonyl-CoA O-methyltransferase
MEFMKMIDRRRVRDSFGRQAGEYETHASVQKRVVARFLEFLHSEEKAPRRILDVGTGTGMLLRSLQVRYGEASAVVGIDLATGMGRKARENLTTDGRTHILIADAEHLPFPAACFDLVVSTSTFQWLSELDTAFGEVFRVMTPGGTFFFALFGENTLHELKAAYRFALAAHHCSDKDRTHTFLSRDAVKYALVKAGFSDCRVSSQLELEAHEDVPALLRSLKRIGAGNASPIIKRGLAGKRIMIDMMQKYKDDFGMGSSIPATYEIVYGFGRKAE